MANVVVKYDAESAHYYLSTGEPCHGDLRSARKAKAFPSVTTILKILESDALTRHKVDAAIVQTLTLPRNDGESEQDYARRVIETNRAELAGMAETGTRIHTLAEQVIADEAPLHKDIDENLRPHLASLTCWARAIDEVVLSEDVVVHDGEGYAGRCDLIAKIDGQTEIVDFKSKNFSKVAPFHPEMPGFATADEEHKVWTDYKELLQLSAYSFAWAGEALPARNVFIDRKTGAIDEKLYTAEQVHDAFEAFRACCCLWRKIKKYDPREVSV